MPVTDAASVPSVPPEALALAPRAWEMMTHAGMPVPAAVDWLRQESGCEDVKLVRRALYRAAADAIKAKSPDHQWPHSTRAIIGDLRDGSAVTAADGIKVMRDWHTQNLDRFSPDRLIWCDIVECYLASLALIDEATGGP